MGRHKTKQLTEAMIPRSFHQAYAWLFGYFWLPCPLCDRMFGGHECGEMSVQRPPSGTRWIACNRHLCTEKR
jgi:hypothetical protein